MTGKTVTYPILQMTQVASTGRKRHLFSLNLILIIMFAMASGLIIVQQLAFKKQERVLFGETNVSVSGSTTPLSLDDRQSSLLPASDHDMTRSKGRVAIRYPVSALVAGTSFWSGARTF